MTARWPRSLPRWVRLGLRGTAVLYTGGAVAHALKLLFDFSWLDMPWAVDWAVVVLGGLGAAALARATGRVAFRGGWERAVHYLIVAHLTLSVLAHLHALATGSHVFFAGFPRSYSAFALAYFGLFAWRSWTLRLGPGQGQGRAAQGL